jgi:hypothetical protein
MVMPTNDEECDVVMSRCFSIGRSVVEFEVVEVETMVGRRVRASARVVSSRSQFNLTVINGFSISLNFNLIKTSLGSFRINLNKTVLHVL